MKSIFYILLFPTFFFVSCCFTEKAGDGAALKVVIDAAKEFQTMEGFGASDCWTTQFVGENWPLAKRDSIADLLFSREFQPNGNPKGIGLSQWRFNIGGGSAEQGEESGIPDVWRRAECFIDSEGHYDWNKQQGQQWFLWAAKERGVEKLLAFCNSAPVHFTKNGKGWSPGGISYNLKSDKMEHFADFLVEVCGHFANEGIAFDYLSPFNEPQWDWKAPASQEGSPAINADIAGMARLLSPKLTKASLHTELMMTEAAQLQFLYRKGSYLQRDNQLNDFFNPASDHYIGALPNLKKTLGGHSYFTTSNIDTLISVRRALKESMAVYQNRVNYWQSEYCILENHEDIGGGPKRDLGMATALYVARVIHFDLVQANAALWSWWTALSVVDYKDGLIYLDNGNSGLTGAADPNSIALQKDGFIRDSKLLWVLGNYSRFVRPGMKRIEIGLATQPMPQDQAVDLMLSAFKANDESSVVLVAVNYSSNDKIVSFDDCYFDGNKCFTTYTTSEDKNLECGNSPVKRVVIPSKSVVTLVAPIVN